MWVRMKGGVMNKFRKTAALMLVGLCIGVTTSAFATTSGTTRYYQGCNHSNTDKPGTTGKPASPGNSGHNC